MFGDQKQQFGLGPSHTRGLLPQQVIPTGNIHSSQPIWKENKTLWVNSRVLFSPMVALTLSTTNTHRKWLRIKIWCVTTNIFMIKTWIYLMVILQTHLLFNFTFRSKFSFEAWLTSIKFSCIFLLSYLLFWTHYLLEFVCLMFDCIIGINITFSQTDNT